MASSHKLYGLHAVRSLLQSRPDSVSAAWVLGPDAGSALEALVRALAAQGVEVRRVRRAELDRLAGGGRHQGVVVETRAPPDFGLVEFEELVVQRGRELRVLVLDGVEDPRNLGACLRTAEAAGIDAVVVPKARTAPLSPAALKAATGAAETVPLLRAPNLARTLAWMKAAGVWVVGADARADRAVFDAALRPPIAIALGGEGRGLRRLTRDLCDELVEIPMAGTVRSLNVSVATGVMLFELLRQTRGARRPAAEPST